MGNRPGELGLQPGSRAEMVEQIGVGAADLRRNRLQGDGLRALAEQELTSGLDRGGPARFGAKAFTCY